jgi:hypothetical protein
MIGAGSRDQIKWGDGNWVFLDIGFSSSERSCGLLIGGAEPQAVRFGEAEQKIIGHIRAGKRPTNLVIEAPLSVCFNKCGNPTGRRFEKEVVERKTTTRYWHVPLGCSVMVAAMYLVRSLSIELPSNRIRLFEGFVSFKVKPTDHLADVLALRQVVKSPNDFADCIISADDMRVDPSDRIVSAFQVCGQDCGIPAVIKIRPTGK